MVSFFHAETRNLLQKLEAVYRNLSNTIFNRISKFFRKMNNQYSKKVFNYVLYQFDL